MRILALFLIFVLTPSHQFPATEKCCSRSPSQGPQSRHWQQRPTFVTLTFRAPFGIARWAMQGSGGRPAARAFVGLAFASCTAVNYFLSHHSGPSRRRRTARGWRAAGLIPPLRATIEAHSSRNRGSRNPRRALPYVWASNTVKTFLSLSSAESSPMPFIILLFSGQRAGAGAAVGRTI